MYGCQIFLFAPSTHQYSTTYVEYLQFEIGAAPTFFRAGSVTLNTPHTKGKSDKIICRTIKITIT